MKTWIFTSLWLVGIYYLVNGQYLPGSPNLFPQSQIRIEPHTSAQDIEQLQTELSAKGIVLSFEQMERQANFIRNLKGKISFPGGSHASFEAEGLIYLWIKWENNTEGKVSSIQVKLEAQKNKNQNVHLNQ